MIKSRCYLDRSGGTSFFEMQNGFWFPTAESLTQRRDDLRAQTTQKKPRAYFKILTTSANQLYLFCQLGRGPFWLAVETPEYAYPMKSYQARKGVTSPNT